MDETSTEPTHLRGIGSFGMIPEWLLLAPISSTAKVLFGWMACKYANRSTWACWPGQTRLAADLDLSVGTIASALKELASVGALTKRQRMQTNGAPSTNYYQLMFLPPLEKLGDPQKTEGPLPQKTEGTLPQKTVDKPEVLEPEVHEREEGHASMLAHPILVESPLQWHKRHGGHVSGFCDWMCLPQELATQFATRASLTDADVTTWAQTVRREWTDGKRVPVGSMWEFWNARWTERQRTTQGSSTSAMATYYTNAAEAETTKRAEQERRRAETRAEMARIAALKQEVWGE